MNKIDIKTTYIGYSHGIKKYQLSVYKNDKLLSTKLFNTYDVIKARNELAEKLAEVADEVHAHPIPEAV